MLNILSDSSKFTQVSVAENKQQNFTINVEKHIKYLLKKERIPYQIDTSCIKSFLNKRLTEKPVILIAEKKDYSYSFTISW